VEVNSFNAKLKKIHMMQVQFIKQFNNEGNMK
jgi:hypothetical protein